MEELKPESFVSEYNNFLDTFSGELKVINEKKCVVLDYEQFKEMKDVIKNLYNELAASNHAFNQKYIENVKLRNRYIDLLDKYDYKRGKLHSYKLYYRMHPIKGMEEERIDREDE